MHNFYVKLILQITSIEASTHTCGFLRRDPKHSEKPFSSQFQYENVLVQLQVYLEAVIIIYISSPQMELGVLFERGEVQTVGSAIVLKSTGVAVSR